MKYRFIDPDVCESPLGVESLKQGKPDNVGCNRAYNLGSWGKKFAPPWSNSWFYNCAKSVKPEVGNTEVNQSLNGFGHRNAYSLNLVREYNGGTSAQHPDWMKMYADHIGDDMNIRIKSLMGNNVICLLRNNN